MLTSRLYITVTSRLYITVTSRLYIAVTSRLYITVTSRLYIAVTSRPLVSYVSVVSLLLGQAWVANFERPRMNANSLLASPTGLSPYLRFGCLSCRLFYFKLTDLYHKVRLSRRRVTTMSHDDHVVDALGDTFH